MGSIRDSTMRRPRPDGRSRPAGAVDAEYLEWNGEPVSATVLVKTGDTWEYGPEIDIRVWPAALRQRELRDGRLYWSGLEARLALCATPFERPWLIAALYPESCQWCAQAELLPAFDGGATRFEGPTRDFRCDPFQEHPGWLTARLDDPMRIHWEEGDALGDGFLLGRGPNRGYAKCTWRFGLCADPEQTAIDLFWASQDLIARTDDDEIFDGLPGHRPLAVSPQVERSRQVARKTHDRSLVADVRPLPVTEQGRAVKDPVLRAAVRQAMAGRPRGSRRKLRFQIRDSYIGLLEAFLKRERRA